jgi:hypothetical protein
MIIPSSSCPATFVFDNSLACTALSSICKMSLSRLTNLSSTAGVLTKRTNLHKRRDELSFQASLQKQKNKIAVELLSSLIIPRV